MVPHPRLVIKGLPNGAAQHRQQGQGGDEDQVGGPHAPAHLPPDLLLPPQGTVLGELRGEHQPQGAQKGRGQQQHGQGHPEGDPVGRYRLTLVHPPLHQQPGDQHRVGGGDQVPQQRRTPQGEGDVEHLPLEGGGLEPFPSELPRRPQVEAEEEQLGDGGEHLAAHHPQHDDPHRPLSGFGPEDHQ